MKPLALLALFATAGPLSAAFQYIETFSTDNDPVGWNSITDGLSSSLVQDPVADNLQFSAADYSIYFLYANAAASLGAFSGNYTAAGITGLSFDLSLDTSTTVSNLFLQLANYTDNEIWTYDLGAPTTGTPTRYSVSLSDSGWTQTAGAQSFASLLLNTQEFSIGFENTSGSGSLVGTLDNVRTIPEPGSFVLLGLAAAALASRRRRCS